MWLTERTGSSKPFTEAAKPIATIEKIPMKLKPAADAFFDAEEKDLIESFEKAIEEGRVPRKSARELAVIRAKWKTLAKNTAERKAITLRVQQRDIERLKVIARQRGMPYQTLVTSVLHQFANGSLKESRD